MSFVHIGKKIAEVLSERHISRQSLGRAIGVSGSAATYLTTRSSIDVATLAAVGNVLKHDFFRYYPVEAVEKQEGAAAKETRIEELEKQLAACRRDLILQKQENLYLKKINALLENQKRTED